jgi:hypothetical protein
MLYQLSYASPNNTALPQPDTPRRPELAGPALKLSHADGRRNCFGLADALCFVAGFVEPKRLE